MSWNKTHIDLGTIKVGSTNKIVFNWIGEELKVISLKASCGCTVPKYSNGVLTAEYKAGGIPKHLKSKGEYTTSKKIIMHSEQGESILSFSANVKQKL